MREEFGFGRCARHKLTVNRLRESLCIDSQGLNSAYDKDVQTMLETICFKLVHVWTMPKLILYFCVFVFSVLVIKLSILMSIVGKERRQLAIEDDFFSS